MWGSVNERVLFSHQGNASFSHLYLGTVRVRKGGGFVRSKMYHTVWTPEELNSLRCQAVMPMFQRSARQRLPSWPIETHYLRAQAETCLSTIKLTAGPMVCLLPLACYYFENGLTKTSRRPAHVPWKTVLKEYGLSFSMSWRMNQFQFRPKRQYV